MNVKTFGEIIKTERISRQLPLRVVANYIDLDQSTLSKIERNERRAPRNLIVPLSKILDLNLNKLMTSYLSDKIADEIFNENDCITILKEAKIKILNNIYLEENGK